MSTEPEATSADNPAADAGAENRARATIRLDESSPETCYANFFKLASTPEEVIFDLGLNSNPYAGGNTTIKITNRVIMNHFTAKRLLHGLARAIEQHEKAFGVLETDVRKRVRGQ